MSNLADVYYKLGRIDDAVNIHRKVLLNKQNVLGRTHPQVVDTMQDLASTYHKIGRTTQAIELAEKALEIRKRKLGIEHPDTLTSMHNLAYFYSAPQPKSKTLGPPSILQPVAYR